MGKTNKLQNIKAVQQMIDGKHKFQTKKTIGFSDAEATKKRNEHHEIGDTWEDVNGNGDIYIVEQFDGFRTRKPKNSEVFSEIRKELKSFPNCLDTCKGVDPDYYLNKKMRAIHGMCFNCVIDMEHELKKQGKFEDYAREKVNANAMAWLKKAEQDVEMLRDAYTTASKLVINGDGETESWAAKMSPEEFEEKIINGFKIYKEDFLKQLNKQVTGENNEHLEED
jgi:hypothetical protein|tara:strand:- start:7858 stop:8529 length:672 start_codon:yes stop_codon:yes gene_type:complete